MDIDFSLEVKHLWVYERPYKVTLTRGASGVYRWEIEVRGSEPQEVLDALNAIEADLLRDYSPLEPTEEEE